MLPQTIKNKILEKQDEGYRKFHQKLVNVPILGVRVPDLKKIASGLSKEERKAVLDSRPPFDYEESMVYGFTVAREKDEETFRKGLETFVSCIDNWATCDCCTSAIKALKQEKYLDYIDSCLASEEEFRARFGVVAVMAHHRSKGVDWVVKRLKTVKQQDYYAMMAVAWCLATLMADDFQATVNSLKEFPLPVQQKAVQKGLESFRVSKEDKTVLRLKRAELSERIG